MRYWMLLLISVANLAYCQARRPVGTANMLSLLSAADVVCRGNVGEIRDGMSPDSAYVTVKTTRIYKGVAASVIQVELPATSWLASVPGRQRTQGALALFFLRHVQSNSFAPVSEDAVYLQLSEIVGRPTETGLNQLEGDLLAGVNDPDSARAWVNLELLFGYPKLRSLRPIEQLVGSAQPMNLVLAYAILIKNLDFKYETEISNFANTIPDDRPIPFDSGPLVSSVGAIEDSRWTNLTISLAKSSNRYFRRAAVDSLRRLKNPKTVPILITLLNDADKDTVLDSINALAEIVGKSSPLYSPSAPEFFSSPERYVGNWKQWWQTEGQAAYRQ